MRTPIVYCSENTRKTGGLDFYLRMNGTDYFLFNQRYSSSVEVVFNKGVELDRAMRTRGNPFIQKVVEKLPKYIKYIESEYEITVLRRSA